MDDSIAPEAQWVYRVGMNQKSKFPVAAALGLAFLTGGLLPERGFADGGVVLEQSQAAGLTATIMASPFPLRAGPADFSVLLQAGGQPVLDAEVSMRWTSSGTGQEWLPPCCSMQTEGGSLQASRGHSGNRLLYSAIVPITSSGPGKLDVAISSQGETSYLTLDLDAAPAPAPILAYWPWLAMTPAAILLFGLHQRITSGRRQPL